MKDNISLQDFIEIMTRTRDSICLGAGLSKQTLEYWYNKFFRFYAKEKLEKIFYDLIQLNNYGTFPPLHRIFEVIKQYGYNPLLHEQLEEIKEKGIKNLSFNVHPDLTEYLKEMK